MSDHDNAVELGWAFATHHAEKSLGELVKMLGIELGEPGWRDRVAPFAPVWAAMIRAAAETHRIVAEAETRASS